MEHHTHASYGIVWPTYKKRFISANRTKGYHSGPGKVQKTLNYLLINGRKLLLSFLLLSLQGFAFFYGQF